MPKQNQILVVIVGPTAIGKTNLSIKLAEHYNSEIISADSRQFYKELKIGTAMPSEEDLLRVKHHLIGHLSIHDNYNAGEFEKDFLKALSEIFKKNNIAFLTGGSGLFIDAALNGFDYFPNVDEKIRHELNYQFKEYGLSWLQSEIKAKDPEFFETSDKNNPRRLLRALEVCVSSGKTYSSFRTGNRNNRDFKTIKIFLNTERKQLYERINMRVEEMLLNGLLNEAKSLIGYKNLNALNTVGYKELFNYLDNKISLEKAIEMIKQNTRRYAKRQITWFKKDNDYMELNPEDFKFILEYLKKEIEKT
ncbi:MAG: tRNA (adenosine(37)-N6)-dimethylallyltransferase MiaA [Bacteroidota bacterium]